MAQYQHCVLAWCLHRTLKFFPAPCNTSWKSGRAYLFQLVLAWNPRRDKLGMNHSLCYKYEPENDSTGKFLGFMMKEKRILLSRPLVLSHFTGGLWCDHGLGLREAGSPVLWKWTHFARQEVLIPGIIFWKLIQLIILQILFFLLFPPWLIRN